MKTLEEMCEVLNRLLDLDNDAAQKLFSTMVPCTPDSRPMLVADPEIWGHLEPGNVVLSPLLIINSLVSEKREDGEYSIFIYIDPHGQTACFFVAKVQRTDRVTSAT